MRYALYGILFAPFQFAKKQLSVVNPEGGPVKEQLEERLKLLQAELEAGQKKLAELEAQAGNLRTTMLRISGAVQVLEEELTKANESPEPVTQPADIGSEKSGASLRSIDT